MLNIFITIFCKNIRYSIRILKRKLVKSKLITKKYLYNRKITKYYTKRN